MGLIKISAKISKGRKVREVEFIVDSGATYTIVPEKVWQELGLKPLRTMNFSLADGTTIKRKISEIRFKYMGLYGTTPVILGEGMMKHS